MVSYTQHSFTECRNGHLPWKEKRHLPSPPLLLPLIFPALFNLSLNNILPFLLCFNLWFWLMRTFWSRQCSRVSERWKGSEAATNKSSFFLSFLPQAGASLLLHICEGQGSEGSASQSSPPASTEEACPRLRGRNRLYQYRFLQHKKSMCNVTVKVSGVLNKWLQMWHFWVGFVLKTERAGNWAPHSLSPLKG